MSGMQMLAGGGVLFLIAAPFENWSAFSFADVSARSWFGFWYLILVASLLGYTAYIYLLTNATPVQASTYAYVNPVVAVALGAMFGAEPLSPRVVVASVVIVAAVALIVTFGTRHATPPRPSPPIPVSATDAA
jgi:drug/metabolite transporter (DMT)-like permease